MRNREDEQAVPIPFERVTGPELHELERVGQPAEHPAQRVEEIAKPGWPIDRQRHLARPQREGLEHSGQSEIVIGVVVRDEDLGQVDEADGRAQELTLSALTTVEQQSLAAATDEQRARRSPSSGRAGGCAEEDHVEIHGQRS